MKKYLTATVFFVFTSGFLRVDAQTQFTGWLASFNTFKTGKKTSIHLDVQWRSTDEIKQMQTLLLRPGINFHLTKQLTLTAGYAFINNKRTINAVTGFVPEHRIWQQLLFTHKLKNIFVAHRLRVEQRFLAKTIINNSDIETDGYVTAGRLRYFIRNIVPLKKQAAFKKGMFAVLQNEVFINTGGIKNVNGEAFDQNRLYVAMGYRLNPKADLEIGYLNQYVNGRGRTSVNNHVIQLAGYLKL